MLACDRVSQAAQPFFAVLLQKVFPQHPIVIVTDNLKTQESFQQDLETWLSLESKVQSPKSKAGEVSHSILHVPPSLLFYPPWDVLPHEGKLPHADTISDRLETLVALNQIFSEDGTPRRPKIQGLVEPAPPKVPIVVTSVTALLQKTFAPDDLKNDTRTLAQGDKNQSTRPDRVA